ncbi:MAG: serine/threonine-protein kinase [Gemmatales bacterium]|nr:serine/threonine protein kinase [Gemmatales bacterium]MDW7994882.1 serine/threonine-protein kinase [Gemmatales bacterium]
MLTAHDRRIARLAVNRFGVDPVALRHACVELLQRRRNSPKSSHPDLVEILLERQLLQPNQAQALREELDKTQVAASPAPPKPADNGTTRSLERVGPYVLLRKVGEGAMGEVYYAYDEQRHQHVAIKILAKHLQENNALVERFIREAELASRLSHPNLVRGYGTGYDERHKVRYLVMEYVDGFSAQQYLDEHGRFTIEDALHVVLDVARALEYAHTHNIIHRDIKPENILITRSGVAKLTDLGLSKQTDQSSTLTGMRQGFGTPYYMPFEQAMNARDADARSDIFALGATLYHMLTGRVPFDGKNQLEILEKKEQGLYTPAHMVNPEIPEDLSRILDRMLARRPEDRFQTMSEVIVALERTKLAGQYLSFADPVLAQRDPVAQLRAQSLEAATVLDVEPSSESLGVWYVRDSYSSGKVRVRRFTTDQLLKAIARGQLNPDSQVATSPQGPFHKLQQYPRFRPALQEAALKKSHTPSPAPHRAFWWWVMGGLGLLLLLVLLLLLWLG